MYKQNDKLWVCIKEQAGAELCQAQFKLEQAKPDIAYSLHGRGSQLSYNLTSQLR